MTSRVLISGGARSGKSAFAESRLRAYDTVDYAVPGSPADPADAEWAARVRTHQERRSRSWRTVETTDLESLLAEPSEVPVLIDCLGTWVAAVLDDAGVWAGRSGADGVVGTRIEGFVAAWRTSDRDAIVVTNEVGGGVVPATASGRRFRDELGRLNIAVAAAADEVWLVTLGIPQRLR